MGYLKRLNSLSVVAAAAVSVIGAYISAAAAAQAAWRSPAQVTMPGIQLSQRRYQLIVFGTFGGPSSYYFGGAAFGRSLAAGSTADTSLPDPYAPNYCLIDCNIGHAFRWQNGVMIDLGGLPGGGTSLADAVNAKGLIAGLAANGLFDSQSMQQEFHAVVWVNRRIVDLGTFGGNFSWVAAGNDRNQFIGLATNTTPDQYALGAELCSSNNYPTQMRAFIWEGRLIRSLGTLGGPDSCALFINQSGQVAGNSYTNFTPNPGTGIPTMDPFLWMKGRRILDLGSLGGTLGLTGGMNDIGEVVGQSNLTGDVYYHPFRWSQGTLKDLGTLGGNYGTASTITDAGDITGTANLSGDQTHHAFLWRRGAMTDLGTVDGDPCSRGFSINSARQIVGTSTDCHNNLHAFLWERGRNIDLNAFVPPSADITLYEADYINDDGAIMGNAALANGNNRSYLMLPCHQIGGGCRGPSDSPATKGKRAAGRVGPAYQFPRAQMTALGRRLFGSQPRYR